MIPMGFFQKLFGKPEQSAPAPAPAPQSSGPIQLFAPLDGQAVPITEVSDPTFGEKILGDGIAIKPSAGKVLAPCDGTVEQIFETGHAVTLTSLGGAEILIHVGLDTVELKGKHYTIHAHDGDKVKTGDLLIEFDPQAIAAEGYDIITPIVICNSDDYSAIKPHSGQMVAAGDLILELEK